MKKIINRITNNKFLLFLVIILQVLIILLLINPFSLISQGELNSVTGKVVGLSNDPDFSNSSVIKVTDADAFKKQYLLSDTYKDLKNDDYVLLINDKFIIYRKEGEKIIFQGKAPSALLDHTRLADLIMKTAKTKKVIANDELPAVKIYVAEVDKDNYSDYFKDIEDGDVLAFFGNQKTVVLYNIQSDEIIGVKKIKIN